MNLAKLTTQIQRLVGTTQDGIYGPNTARAILSKLGDDELPPASVKRFSTQAQVRAGNSEFGKRGENQTLIILPYAMRLAWDTSIEVRRMSINRACADSALLIFRDALTHYGKDRIRELGLDLFGGCLNVRKVRGGSQWSIHSWGAAIDLDPDNNSLHADHRTARFARSEYRPFWEIVESHGWTSLGRERDYDWMHLQAPTL